MAVFPHLLMELCGPAPDLLTGELCSLVLLHPPRPTLFPYTTLFRSHSVADAPATVAARTLDDYARRRAVSYPGRAGHRTPPGVVRSAEHTSELQSPYELLCRLLLEKKKCDGCLSTPPDGTVRSSPGSAHG